MLTVLNPNGCQNALDDENGFRQNGDGDSVDAPIRLDQLDRVAYVCDENGDGCHCQ